ncbi:nucleoside-diphosphate-sugar epimerase [Allocatelliglobosispora scoriae]|uniref:Nucleoside-diphosphate-sugar epimerase n=1 Tax=Allocatelliglobosispora scoriae TaxID=643052 RepID=A0A841BFI5_9ACTN|nr:NAD-dependent epimerase/dehydratase family protein [Allocatelliglobosispora scoriae]MBB5867054.1 nucleoside-diphosphate-sugar epimerase [Allocatelliglobosispora scoriae]
MTHVVLGAGQTGRPLAAALAAAGLGVRVVSRTRPAGLPAGAEHRGADLTDVDATIAACAGASVVYHTAGAPVPQWDRAFPAVMASVLAGAAAASARLVYLDNLYAFGPPEGAITEASPPNPVEAKGRLRLHLAELVLGAAGRGDLPGATVAHAADFFGPGVRNSVPGALVLRAVEAGKVPRWPVALDEAHSLAYTPDVAAALAAIGASAGWSGARRRIIAAQAPTGREFLAAAGGRPGAVLSLAALRVAGIFSRGARDLAGLAWQYDRPYVADGTLLRQETGLVPTPLAVALA